MTARRGERPAWPAVISMLLCLAGIAVASYLTYAHYTTAKVLACSDKGLVNCAKVTTSSYSRIMHLPVSDTGLAFFLFMAVLCSPWAWRSDNRLLRTVRVLAAAAGVGMIMWLVYVELFRLDAICLYCTAVHVITVLLFFAIVFGTTATSPGFADEEEDESPSGSAPTRERSRRAVGAQSTSLPPATR